jgi:hypothetical protein
VRIHGWLFLDAFYCCGEHAGSMLRELTRMGWTFPFVIDTIEPRQPAG